MWWLYFFLRTQLNLQICHHLCIRRASSNDFSLKWHGKELWDDWFLHFNIIFFSLVSELTESQQYDFRQSIPINQCCQTHTAKWPSLLTKLTVRLTFNRFTPYSWVRVRVCCFMRIDHEFRSRKWAVRAPLFLLSSSWGPAALRKYPCLQATVLQN